MKALAFAPDPSKVDWNSWARVVAFQTWLYAGDPQAVIRATDGKIFSVDHGDCFRELAPGRPTGLIVPNLYGISGTQFDATAVALAVDAIESITEQDLVMAAAGIPGDDPGWRMSIERRVRVIEWLMDRQPGVREVMRWMLRFS